MACVYEAPYFNFRKIVVTVFLAIPPVAIKNGVPVNFFLKDATSKLADFIFTHANIYNMLKHYFPIFGMNGHGYRTKVYHVQNTRDLLFVVTNGNSLMLGVNV